MQSCTFTQTAASRTQQQQQQRSRRTNPATRMAPIRPFQFAVTPANVLMDDQDIDIQESDPSKRSVYNRQTGLTMAQEVCITTSTVVEWVPLHFVFELNLKPEPACLPSTSQHRVTRTSSLANDASLAGRRRADLMLSNEAEIRKDIARAFECCRGPQRTVSLW